MPTRRRWALVGLVVAVLMQAPLPASPAGAAQDADPETDQATAQQEDGLDLAVDSTYRVRPYSVEVTLDVTAVNVTSTVQDGYLTSNFYFDRIGFVVPGEAGSVRASRGEDQLGVELTAGEGVIEVTVDLSRRLLQGQTENFTVAFELPGGLPRSDDLLRVNPAFAWFFVWAYGDPGRAGVKVVLDGGFEVDVLGSPLSRRQTTDGSIVLAAEAIADPASWYAEVLARNDANLEITMVGLGNSQVDVHAWPGDTEWGRVVAETLESGVPVLEALTGLDWPQPSLPVVESFAPNRFGYGGWYLAGGRIEIGEAIDRLVILHEASHAWFNDELFADRWINEGLAGEFADRAVVELGDETTPPETVGLSGRMPLNRWVDPTTTLGSDATERYGYAVSRGLIKELIDEIGLPAMVEVLAAAKNDQIAYQGEGAPETVWPQDDWRRLLDLVEELGGSGQASNVWRELVATSSQANWLDDRRQTRLAYRSLEESAASWGIPLRIRAVMGRWEFDQADAGIAEAMALVESRDRLSDEAARWGLDPPSLETEFETAKAFGPVAAMIEDQAQALSEVAEMLKAVARDRVWLDEVGLIAAGLPEEVEQAERAFEDDRLDVARVEAAEVMVVLAGAGAEGERRAIITGGGLVFLALAAILVRRRISTNRGYLGSSRSP